MRSAADSFTAGACLAGAELVPCHLTTNYVANAPQTHYLAAPEPRLLADMKLSRSSVLVP